MLTTLYNVEARDEQSQPAITLLATEQHQITLLVDRGTSVCEQLVQSRYMKVKQTESNLRLHGRECYALNITSLCQTVNI